MYSLELKLKVISRITSKCTAITFYLKGAYDFSTISSQMASFCSVSYSFFVTLSFETFCSLNLLPDWGPYIWAFHFFPFLAEFGSVLTSIRQSSCLRFMSHPISSMKSECTIPLLSIPDMCPVSFRHISHLLIRLIHVSVCSLWSTSSVFHFLYTLVSLLHYPSYLKEIVYIIITNFLNIPSAFTICSSLPFYALSSQHAPVI